MAHFYWDLELREASGLYGMEGGGSVDELEHFFDNLIPGFRQGDLEEGGTITISIYRAREEGYGPE